MYNTVTVLNGEDVLGNRAGQCGKKSNITVLFTIYLDIDVAT